MLFYHYKTCLFTNVETKSNAVATFYLQNQHVLHNDVLAPTLTFGRENLRMQKK